MRQKKLAQRAASAALAACMMFTLSAPALAESTNALMQLSINSRSSIARLNEQNSIPEDAKTLNIADGDIEVSVSAEGVQTATQGGQTYTGVFVVTGTSTTSKLVIKGSSGTAAKVYLNDLHITVSSGAAVSVSNNVDLYIEGSSVLQSGENCAGIQKEDDGQLTIDGSGSLEATGGESGAGIGGASGKPGNNITINGGTITASGKAGNGWGAGIGGGKGQGGSNITIRGGNVKAIPGAEAAGIGGGFKGNGTDISIEGGTVYAESGGGNGGTAAIGGGRAGGNGENIQITGGDITLKKADAADIGIGGKGIEIPVADTFSGTLTYLDENGTQDTDKSVVKYGITVNGEEFNSLNKDKILNGALRYDPATKTLSLNEDQNVNGVLTINAPGTDIVLDGGIYSVLQGKLVIEAAANVTLTSTEARAVFGDANITCTGKLRITCENIAVDGNLTVNNASSVELIGKNDNGGTVTGAAVFNNTGEVTIQNKDATKGAAHSISYSGDYVYYTAEGGALTDPRITPIAADASYLHIVRSELHSITVPEGCTFKVDGADLSTAHAGQPVTVTAPDKGDHFEFAGWTISPDSVTLNNADKLTATFIMPNENVELKARYNKLYTITVDGGHADVTSALTGKEITVDADVPDGKKFMGWKADGITLTPAQQQSKHITFFMPEGNVTLTAEYKTLHTVTVIGANGTSTVLPDTYIEGDTVTVNAADYGIPADEFDSWESNDIRLTTDKRQSPTLTFKMVDKNVTLIAVPKTLFTITVTGGTVNGESTTARVKAGDWVTIKAENKGDDWKFIEWKLTGPENFTLDTSQSTVQFQMPSGNVTLEAVQMEYRTVTINNGNSPTTVNDKALHGDSITVTADEVDGKRFAYWEVTGPDGTEKLTDKKITVTVPEGDITLTAKYNELYTVTVDDEIVGAFIEGEWVPIKANVPEDRKFEGWTSPDTLPNELHGNENNAEFKLLMPGHNVTLNATTSQRYYVTVNDEGNELHPSEKMEVAAGDSFYLEAAGRDGWEFIGWTVDNEDVAKQLDLTKAERQSFTMPKNTNVTVTAKYMKYRTITVIGGTVNGATTITDALREQEVEIKAVYDPEEQVFDHWEAEGPDGWALTEEQKGAESFTLKVPKGNVTLKAVYKTLHTVTVINGTAQNGETTIKAVAGEKITLTPNLPDDKEFDCWYSEEINLREDQRKTPELTFKMRDFDITIEAKPKQLYFVELADADTTANGGSGNVEVKSGEDVTIVAPEREGWKFIRWEVSDNAHLDNATASEAHFTMPSGNVSVKAVYYEYHTITMTDDKGTAYNEKGEEITRAVQGDVITIKAKKNREDHEFNRWVITPDNGTLAGKNDPETTFTMPNEAVEVDAKYKHLQGITVNGGAAYYMDGTPAETAKAGETIVIVAEDRSKDGLRFAYWEVNSDKEVNVEGGEKATFEMVNAPVELTAHYEAQITYSNDPAIFDEGVGLHEDIVWEKVGDTASITAVLDNSTDEDDIGTFPGMTFDYWEIVTPENLNVTSGLNSETITFEVPECEVKLIAHWKDTTTVTPAEPLDPGFPVEPEAPADGSGAVIGVAAAGAAIWGGYEITTRVILNDLLPEGAAIPTNRGELAMLIWTQKGKPEPAAEPDFTDVSDTELAKAAQWCVEQGLLTAEDGKFEPDGRTPKWRVIQVWNQAFPKE